MTPEEACLAYAKEVEALVGPIDDRALSEDSTASSGSGASSPGASAESAAFRHRSLFDIAGVSAIKHARDAETSGARSVLEQRAEEYAHISVTLERTSGVAFVNLARPEKMNALHMPLWEEITDVFRRCSDDPLVRCVVLGGEGEHFCSGMDLSVFGKLAALADVEPCEGRRREQLSTVIQYFQDGCSAPEFCTKPVLASIHGNAVGGAVDLLTACDLRYCTDDAHFCVKEVDLAIVADVGTMQRLPKLVGDQRARELTYTARGFGGHEAKDMGLVLESFATRELLDAHVADVARQIASKSSITVRGIKQVSLYTRDHPDVTEGLAHVKQWNTSYLMTADLQEAAGAMMERRKPKFDRF
jgi:enoyl-CoA hydratase/carnithine racemase